MINNQLLYLVYGPKKEYIYEAKFSILSALARSQSKKLFDIVVMTDHPEAFVGWPVSIKKIYTEQLNQWLGGSKYTHRRKACAILEALPYAEKTIFINTDTFFLKDPIYLNSWMMATI